LQTRHEIYIRLRGTDSALVVLQCGSPPGIWHLQMVYSMYVPIITSMVNNDGTEIKLR